MLPLLLLKTAQGHPVVRLPQSVGRKTGFAPVLQPGPYLLTCAAS